MKYYPLNRVKTNLKTFGNDFTLNGSAYTGLYYETYTGECFTGPDPVTGPSELLLRPDIPGSTTDRPLVVLDGNEDYNNVTKLNLQQLETFQTPQPYYPQPTDADYKRGSIL